MTERQSISCEHGMGCGIPYPEKLLTSRQTVHGRSRDIKYFTVTFLKILIGTKLNI
jgi:hypothetical protein